MHSAVAFMCGAFLFAVLHFLWADSGSALPPQTFDIPFDDVDPAVMQAEVERQVAAFLHSIEIRWGQSQETVRRSVTGEIQRDEQGALVYARALSDHGVLEGYEFRDGHLVGGQYLLLQRPVNGLNEFIDYYAAVKQSLTAAYGAPAQDQTIWDNELYQPLPDYWGVAVQIGHLRYAARWETAEGIISLELTGNHHSRLMIEYQRRHSERVASSTSGDGLHWNVACPII